MNRSAPASAVAVRMCGGISVAAARGSGGLASTPDCGGCIALETALKAVAAPHIREAPVRALEIEPQTGLRRGSPPAQSAIATHLM